MPRLVRREAVPFNIARVVERDGECGSPSPGVQV